MMKSKTLMIATSLLGGAVYAGAYEVTVFPTDANRDGIVTAQEHANYYGSDMPRESTTDRMEQQAQLGPTPAGEASYRRADANRDGYVSQEEWQQHREQIESRMGAVTLRPSGSVVGVPPNESGEATYWRADSNRDGHVSAEEWEQYRMLLEQQS